MTDEGRPLCKCHGEPMHRNGCVSNGRQTWDCRQRGRTKAKAYRATPEGKAYMQAYMQVYRATPEYKERQQAYDHTRRATPKRQMWTEAYIVSGGKAKAVRKYSRRLAEERDQELLEELYGTDGS